MHANLKTGLVLTVVTGLSAIALAATEEFKGDTTEGWMVWDLKANQQDNSKITSSEGSLHFKYDRAGFVLLGHMRPVTDLKELKVVITSDADITVAFAVEDQDKARFHYPVELKAGKETTVTVKPEHFKPSDDSPTKKEKVEPARLGAGYALVDLGAFTGATGDNTLHIKQVTITRN